MLTSRERDRLEARLRQALVKALDAVVNPPLDGHGLAVALLNTGTALHLIAELDDRQLALNTVLPVLALIGRDAQTGADT